MIAKLFTILISALLPSSATLLFTLMPRQGDTLSGDGEKWTLIRKDGARSIRIKSNGMISFADDYSGIESLPPGGSFIVEEATGSGLTRLEVRARTDGSLQYLYSAQGDPRDFDDNAKKWLSSLLLEVVRKSGFDASGRVRRLFQQGGADAVLEEVS